MKLFSHEIVQKQWASVDYRKNMSMIGLVQRGGHQEIVAIGTYAQEDDDSAEIAFVVREDFQGMGIASYLLEILEEIALENNYRRFTATVLKDNPAMLSVFRKRYPNAKISNAGGNEVTVVMDFQPDGAAGQSKRSAPPEKA